MPTISEASIVRLTRLAHTLKPNRAIEIRWVLREIALATPTAVPVRERVLQLVPGMSLTTQELNVIALRAFIHRQPGDYVTRVLPEGLYIKRVA